MSQCENIGRDYRRVGTESIAVNDLVSFWDTRSNRRVFGNVVQIMGDYTMRVRANNRVYRIEDRDITREGF